MLHWCHCVWWSINKLYKVWWYWTDGNQFLWYYVIIALVPLLPSYEQFTMTAENIDPITIFDYKRHVMGKKRNHINLRFKETNNNILTGILLSHSTLLIGIWNVELPLTTDARSARLWVIRDSISSYLICLPKFPLNDVRQFYFM